MNILLIRKKKVMTIHDGNPTDCELCETPEALGKKRKFLFKTIVLRIK